LKAQLRAALQRDSPEEIVQLKHDHRELKKVRCGVDVYPIG
jgi:hypothetical protein